MRFLVAGMFLPPTVAQACSVCVGWAEGQGLSGGFYWSALLLTALPFAVIAVIGVWVSRGAWRARSNGSRDPFRQDRTIFLTRGGGARHGATRRGRKTPDVEGGDHDQRDEARTCSDRSD